MKSKRVDYKSFTIKRRITVDIHYFVLFHILQNFSTD